MYVLICIDLDVFGVLPADLLRCVLEINKSIMSLNGCISGAD
jgi:hypothetical protein